MILAKALFFPVLQVIYSVDESSKIRRLKWITRFLPPPLPLSASVLTYTLVLKLCIFCLCLTAVIVVFSIPLLYKKNKVSSFKKNI